MVNMVNFENYLTASLLYRSVMVYEPVAVCGMVETHFYIFEQRERYPEHRLPSYMEMMVCVFPRKNEFPVAVVIKTEKEIHDCWLNYFAPEERGKEAIKALGAQEDICFHFINNLHDRVCSSVFVAGNTQQDVFREAEGRLQSYAPWPMQGFGGAVYSIIKRFRTKRAFWDFWAKEAGKNDQSCVFRWQT